MGAKRWCEGVGIHTLRTVVSVSIVRFLPWPTSAALDYQLSSPSVSINMTIFIHQHGPRPQSKRNYEVFCNSCHARLRKVGVVYMQFSASTEFHHCYLLSSYKVDNFSSNLPLYFTTTHSVHTPGSPSEYVHLASNTCGICFSQSKVPAFYSSSSTSPIVAVQHRVCHTRCHHQPLVSEPGSASHQNGTGLIDHGESCLCLSRVAAYRSLRPPQGCRPRRKRWYKQDQCSFFYVHIQRV
ncbi:hypothetical protein P152DRAFT_88760 [Eremomyces bilateralis CBS 781.70]|uniref:Uncharacterized protein n=1 Tax=Eremomyces bilateralis CBS 781.70 TaxID=1392243 RepID=A0A6G1FXN6_9PEZI|nr:uncharacterized protein P152DRAFT_88760 [Eremomyces bilateralis CBS 781.70]KAF1810544.1 hypothetical protein P152DRAFT_88760 [Eremomyces bilateralis CBS 781.70]